MNKKGIRQFSPEMRLRSRDRWRIKGASPSGTSRGPTFSPKFHLNVLNLGRNDMKIVRNHEAVQHPNPRFRTPEVEPVSHSNSRARSGCTHRSGSGSSAHETAQDPRESRKQRELQWQNSSETSGAPPLRSGSEPTMAGLRRRQERGAAGDEEGFRESLRGQGPSGTQGSEIFESGCVKAKPPGSRAVRDSGFWNLQIWMCQPFGTDCRSKLFSSLNTRFTATFYS